MMHLYMKASLILLRRLKDKACVAMVKPRLHGLVVCFTLKYLMSGCHSRGSLGAAGQLSFQLPASTAASLTTTS